ncbi:Hypothetical predicted protein [Marmota monax]|uniref:D(1B) dopamine receptor n=1 Tax=Marmota monax TaxID=9995 RepID=A0A5E4ARH3_MARMO|nr:Hypothetical predicted protein [Marmota monax]
MLPPGRNGTAYWARFRLQQQLVQGGALGGSAGAAPLGPLQVVTAGLLTLLIVWTLFGNVLVCAAIVRSRHLRAKMTNVFIVSLAVSDLFVALLVMPWKAVAEKAAENRGFRTGSGRQPAFCNGDQQAGFPCVSETTFDVFVWFGWANSSLNPIIYAFNADFRKVFAQLLGCSHLCSRTRVETVNISNELISYNQDTVFHKETVGPYIHMIPNAVAPGDRQVDNEEKEEEGPLDHLSGTFQTPPAGDPAAESVCDLDCEGEISLGKIIPFTPNGLPETA